MESDGYYPWQSSPESLATLDLLISYHQHADVQLNYTHPNTLAEMLAPPAPKDPDHLICAFISNTHSLSGRERLVERLEKILPIHHYGKWHHNTPEPRLEGYEAKLDILKKYHFCLAIENTLQPRYVTEKWFHCFATGCVPVYYGAPDIADFAPSPSSYLNIRSFRRLEDLAETLRNAAQDLPTYQRFFDWKQNPSPTFTSLFTNTLNHLSLMAKVDHRIARSSQKPLNATSTN
jgi:alpha-1,3-fucosyltransferase 10